MSEKTPKFVMFEVISGVEGPCLSISDERGGQRIAGPKPWGGGRITHTFRVDADNLKKLIKEYARPEKAGAQ